MIETYLRLNGYEDLDTLASLQDQITTPHQHGKVILFIKRKDRTTTANLVRQCRFVVHVLTAISLMDSVDEGVVINIAGEHDVLGCFADTLRNHKIYHH